MRRGAQGPPSAGQHRKCCSNLLKSKRQKQRQSNKLPQFWSIPWLTPTSNLVQYEIQLKTRCEWHCIVFIVSVFTQWKMLECKLLHILHKIHWQHRLLDLPYKTVSEGFPLIPTHSNFYNGAEIKQLTKYKHHRKSKWTSGTWKIHNASFLVGFGVIFRK